MSSDDLTATQSTDSSDRIDDQGHPRRPRDWWHRDHPTFTALSGFFTGVFFASLVPLVYAVVLDSVTDDRTTEEAFPFVLLALLVPLVLVVSSRTRRFGQYMWIGIALAAAIILGVATVVTVMFNRTTL